MEIIKTVVVSNRLSSLKIVG